MLPKFQAHVEEAPSLFSHGAQEPVHQCFALVFAQALAQGEASAFKAAWSHWLWSGFSMMVPHASLQVGSPAVVPPLWTDNGSFSQDDRSASASAAAYGRPFEALFKCTPPPAFPNSNRHVPAPSDAFSHVGVSCRTLVLTCDQMAAAGPETPPWKRPRRSRLLDALDLPPDARVSNGFREQGALAEGESLYGVARMAPLWSKARDLDILLRQVPSGQRSLQARHTAP